MKLDPNARKLAQVFRTLKRSQWKKSPIKEIKYSEFLVLVHLNREVKEDSKGLKVSELSRLLEVKKPTVTQLINSLDNGGYIERNHDQQDRRVVRIKLSQYGKEEMKKAYNEYVSYYNGLVEALGEEKSIQLTELLEEVQSYYDETQNKNK